MRIIKTGIVAPLVDKLERLMTLKEFAEFVGLSYQYAWLLAKKGKFKKIGRRVGSQWRFYKPTVLKYYER